MITRFKEEHSASDTKLSITHSENHDYVYVELSEDKFYEDYRIIDIPLSIDRVKDLIVDLQKMVEESEK